MATERAEATDSHDSCKVAAQSAVPVPGQPASMCRSSSTSAGQQGQLDEVRCMPWRWRRAEEARHPARTREIHLMVAGATG